MTKVLSSSHLGFQGGEFLSLESRNTGLLGNAAGRLKTFLLLTVNSALGMS